MAARDWAARAGATTSERYELSGPGQNRDGKPSQSTSQSGSRTPSGPLSSSAATIAEKMRRSRRRSSTPCSAPTIRCSTSSTALAEARGSSTRWHVWPNGLRTTD